MSQIPASADGAVPNTIPHKMYFMESVRLEKLAEESFAQGDYDASVSYAEQAKHYARLSDEYVSGRLRVKEADDMIAAASARLDWARLMDATTRHADKYGEAQLAFEEARAARSIEDWEEALGAAKRVMAVLTNVTEAPPAPKSGLTREGHVLPAQYRVRSWYSVKDCLWNIAAEPWVYGDPEQWRVLYEANKNKFPRPDNPNMIKPGTVLDIPSLQGEVRQGQWQPGRTYKPLVAVN
jgi:nucleoid-associated protein YgaU